MESYSRYPRALPRLLLQPQVGLFPCCLWRDASGPCPWTAKSGSDVGHGFILGLWCSCAPLFVLVLVPLHRGFDGLLVGQLPDPAGKCGRSTAAARRSTFCSRASATPRLLSGSPARRSGSRTR